jgi:hypothetical protein
MDLDKIFFSRTCIARFVLSKRGALHPTHEQKVLSSYKLQPMDQPSSTPLLYNGDSHHELKQSSANGDSCAQPNFLKNLNQTSLE